MPSHSVKTRGSRPHGMKVKRSILYLSMAISIQPHVSDEGMGVAAQPKPARPDRHGGIAASWRLLAMSNEQ